MTAKFILIDGEPEGTELSLDHGEEWVVGRDEKESQLLIQHPKVSRRHCLCKKTEKGVTIENFSKTNPVLVNKQQISGEHFLKDGDEVKLGGGIFRFISETEPVVIKGLDGEDSLEDVQEEIFGDEEFFWEDEESAEHHDTVFKVEGEDVELAKINFDMMEAGRWLMKVISGPNAGADFALKAGSEYIIGTNAAECDIIFHDISVSQRHALLSLSDDGIVTCEDLGSRNGTYLAQGRLKKGEKKTVSSQTVVTAGTTAFVIVDKEAGLKTIVSPVVPLQKGCEKMLASPAMKEKGEKQVVKEEAVTPQPPEKFGFGITGKVLIGVIAAVLLMVGIGTITIFDTEDVVVEQVDVYKHIRAALKHFPDVQFTYNSSTGKLFLLGHVLTTLDKNQLLHNLQSLTFISSMVDNIIIDELVWKEMNQTLQWNPVFHGISMHSPRAGLFVLSGYLETKRLAEQLSEYVSLNFPYLDRLENRVVVEEEIMELVNALLGENNFANVGAELIDGELTINGNIQPIRSTEFKMVIRELEKIRGVRLVKNFVIERQTDDAAVANISDQYMVTGYSKMDNMNVSVVINGRILARGDVIDGMTIVSIRPATIFLEREGIKYRIDYKD